MRALGDPYDTHAGEKAVASLGGVVFRARRAVQEAFMAAHPDHPLTREVQEAERAIDSAFPGLKARSDRENAK